MRILLLLCLFSVTLGAVERPYQFHRLDRKADIFNLDTTIQDLYDRKIEKSIAVDTLSSQSIAGNKTFSGGTTLSSATVNTTLYASSLTVTNTLTANEATTTYGFFHDRGDASAWDFTEATLTTDGTWRDLDLSSIVPAGAKTVVIHISIVDDAASSFIQFRKKGNSNPVSRAFLRTQVANVGNDNDLICACDSNRVIQYNASNTTFTNIYITVKGWWK